ncbi:hypothetical protein C8J27_106261 [Rhodobacter aestuarii]|uniref:Uncharacterized protein n=1 Tax=Rhodobacter aestuarii TaxID=453582 RepID=A0A1N7MCF3_9RHOB|nr:hypothetical protein [Rhodobacter aestuarii]PTV94991.1 hypothetical protein C8J27_106261 [Rhodobacter aestuarii]SIS83750.1 hypothetical protein SAMN05421580_105261 [Rhodobacter aestuarii]
MLDAAKTRLATAADEAAEALAHAHRHTPFGLLRAERAEIIRRVAVRFAVDPGKLAEKLKGGAA